MAYPLIVSAVAFCFCAIVFRQYLSRGRPHQLVWTFALLLGGLAGIFFVLFLVDDRSTVFFRLYYVCGALLMAAYLGLGSLYLLAPRRIAHLVAFFLGPLSLAGAIVLWTAPIDRSALHITNVEAGTHLVTGPAVAFIAVFNTFGAVAVLGGAGFSVWTLLARHGPARLVAANSFIALGTILASLAGSLARVLDNGAYFWLLLATGFVVLFAGFLLTTPRSTATGTQPRDVLAAAGSSKSRV